MGVFVNILVGYLRQPAASIPHNEVFNELFSPARQVIEHVNGILKGRFQSLKGIRVEIKTAHDLNFFCEWILVCIILHNILIRLMIHGKMKIMMLLMAKSIIIIQ